MTSENKIDYKQTLHLPQTDFPMKADLPVREPQTLQFWQSQQTYQKMVERNQSNPKFTLHDGPPYANGNIHFGHILNKVLKDILIKYKSMAGFLSEYIPGWDCHGLPIEHQVDKKLGPKKKSMSVVEVRQACRDYAQSFVESQRAEFQRLGIFARWDQPYLTMNYSYEAAIERELQTLIRKGSVYRGYKPVHWCMYCQTALAEAEVEYENHQSPSIYVKFAVTSDLSELSPKLKGKDVFFLIWTTTPWTLPANQAIALHKNYTYVALEVSNQVFIVAEGLLDFLRKELSLEDARLLDRLPSKKLEGVLYQHPFLNRTSPIVLSDHVTLDQGTGCVHIAPAHGQDDYEVGQRYGIQTISPVDAAGRFTEAALVPDWIGKKVLEANPLVCELLQTKGALHLKREIDHSYPHCWRCKHPVIFRATDQWFISMKSQDLRERALDAIRRSEWVPQWGRERIYGMIENRSDWCISRQRSWGVPIVAFSCRSCKTVLIDPDLMTSVIELFEKEGADAWFTREASQLLPAEVRCQKCGSKEFEKEKDILDVWFDSGVSFAAVVERESNLQFPADLYLEGTDQHRGWFHSSLLASIATRDAAPYKTVLTHGFVVDGEGRKYSKSAKNYTSPEILLKKMGAEILRLWVAAEDYRNDIRFSDEIVARLSETYRKIRNTCRYLLGNLFDFNPATDTVELENLHELDRWVLSRLVEMADKLSKSYQNFEFHQIYHTLNHFCTVELSSFYLDILKDRLYTSAKKSQARRSAQTVLFHTVRFLSLWMAPILSFTAEEVWKHIPAFPEKTESVFLSPLWTPPAQWTETVIEHKMEVIIALREEILKALEIARKNKIIGSSLEAQVRVSAEEDLMKVLKEYERQWPTYFIVSQVVITYEIEEPTYALEEWSNLKVLVLPAEGKKCERCWNYSLTVGLNTKHIDLCERCAKVLDAE